ncbi:MAG: AsmA-like C-terminal region-containing protein [Bacteroidales bacterium]
MASNFNHKLSLVWQFIRLALVSGLVFILVVVVALSVLTYVYRDNIKEVFVKELINKLESETHIEDVSVNLFRSFPKASVTLNNVVMMEAVDKAEKDTLLSARRVHFQFSIMDLIRKEYNIKQMEVVLADFNPVIFKDGSVNYMVWKSNGGEEAGQDFVFDFEKFSMKRVNVHFSDHKKNIFLDFMAEEAMLSGHFSASDYTLNINGDFFADEIKIDNTEFLKKQNTSIDLTLNVKNNEMFSLEAGAIDINSHKFNVSGEIDLSGEDMFLDLALAGKRIDLDNLLMDMPRSFSSFFDGYKIKGQMFFNASISGTYSSVVNPFIRAEFGLQNGEVSDRKTGVQMKDLSFAGKFNNGRYRKLKSSALALTDFYTDLNNGFLEGDLKIYNFDIPNIELNLNSDITLSDLMNFLKIEKVKNAEGKLNLKLDFIGRISDGKKFRPNDFISSTAIGKVNFDGVSFKLLNDPKDYNSFSGNLLFNNNDLIVENLAGKVSSSDFSVVGYLKNFLSYLFFDDQNLAVNARFNAEHLNFNELLQHNVAGSDTTYKLSFSDRLSFTMNANVENLVFNKFEAFDVNGSVYLRNKSFMADKVNFKTMDGKVEMSGNIDGTDPDVLKINSYADVENVEIRQLFYQLENFGQTAIVDKHLKGKLNSNVQFSANWSPYLEIDWGSLVSDAHLVVENGELIDFKPILELSRFLKIGDLHHINFSTLENNITIKNQTVFIPFMEINSSAIDIKLSGEHYFNNEIDYRLQVALSDILASRSRQNRNPQEKYGEIIDDGHSRTLFLLLTGTIDDPIFKYDTKSALQKFRDDLRKESKNLKEIFKKEFGISPVDTLEEVKTEEEIKKIKEREEIKKGEEGDFIIEWD